MKKIFDIVVSFFSLLFLFPLMIIISILIKVNLGSPIIFSQIRAGKNEKSFMLYKFRTMKNLFDYNGKALSDSQRLTRFGAFLRSTSLDELPSLINILKGDMSIVGPRPLLMEYLPLYNDNQKKRHLVSPGLTGWAQIHGRNSISWQEKFELDVWYVENRNFMLDIIIIIKTIKKVLLREGIRSTTSSTMEKFKGN